MPHEETQPTEPEPLSEEQRLRAHSQHLLRQFKQLRRKAQEHYDAAERRHLEWQEVDNSADRLVEERRQVEIKIAALVRAASG